MHFVHQQAKICIEKMLAQGQDVHRNAAWTYLGQKCFSTPNKADAGLARLHCESTVISATLQSTSARFLGKSKVSGQVTHRLSKAHKVRADCYGASAILGPSSIVGTLFMHGSYKSAG